MLYGLFMDYGFLYRFSQPGAIATELSSSSSSASGAEFRRQTGGDAYVTLMAGYYNENFHVDMPQTFHTTDRRIVLTRPLIYAHLDYCNAQGMILNRTLTPSILAIALQTTDTVRTCHCLQNSMIQRVHRALCTVRILHRIETKSS